MSLKERIKGIFGNGSKEATQVSRGDVRLGHGKQTLNLNFTKEQIRKGKHKSKFPWLYDPNREHGSRWDFDPIDLRWLSQENIWVYMLIESISKEVSKTPWQVYKRGEDENPSETQKRLDKSPFERKPIQKDDTDETVERATKLLSDPNPEDSYNEFVEMIVADMLEVGAGTVIKDYPEEIFDGDRLKNPDAKLEELPPPVSLRASDPVMWTKDYTDRGTLEGFWQFGRRTTMHGMAQRLGEKPIYFDRPEVGWLDFGSRSNRRYGLPPTLVAKPYLELLDLTISQELDFFSRGLISPGILVAEKYDQEEIDELLEMFDEIKGNPHEVPMMAGKEGDVSWINMTQSFKDLQFNERAQWYSKVISSAFQVPTSVVGLKPEKVNYNTFQGERENFEHNTLGPYLQQWERFVNKFIMAHFGDEYIFELVPGMSESTRGLISTRIREELKAGLITPNEARRQLGYDEVEGGDELLDPVQETPNLNLNLNEHTEDKSERVTKPFAGYDNFEECVADNQDKEDPEGFCAWLHNEVEGEYPSEKSDEPLRETEEWHQFDYQPSDVDDLKDDLVDMFDELWNEVLISDKIEEVIERFATASTSKSLNSISRNFRSILTATKIIEDMQELINVKAGEKALENLEKHSNKTGLPIDTDRVRERLMERDTHFVLDVARRMESDIRDVVADGWSEGKGIEQIKDDLMDKSNEFTDWEAERIARDQMQRATSEARNEFAVQHNDLFGEVWLDSDDHRVRPAHREMSGKWKRPSEYFPVEYNGELVKEKYPGGSKFGILCRCTTLLRPIDELDPADHVGVT